MSIPAIVGHAAGVERVGKCYPMIHTKLRTSLSQETLTALIFIFVNMRFAEPAAVVDTVAFDSFALGLVDDNELQSALPALSTITRVGPRPQAAGTPRRDESSSDSSSSSGGNSSDGDEDEADSSDPRDSDVADMTTEGSIVDQVPNGFTAILQAPSGPLDESYLKQYIMAKVKIPLVNRGQPQWLSGQLTRFFSPKTDKKYGALYNFDVAFVGLRGAVGMKLEANGEKTAYAKPGQTAESAENGTWMLLKRLDP